MGNSSLANGTNLYYSDTQASYIYFKTTHLHERQVAWQVKYASGKVLGIILSMPPLNFSFRS